MIIGVLAIQGGFAEHINMLKKHNIATVEIRKKTDLDHDFQGLIIPGGESTTITKLLHELDIYEPLAAKIKNGLPVFGTCAGLILLAKNINNQENSGLNAIDITVERNGYGRQSSSFSSMGTMKNIGKIPMVFIRAPYITKTAPNVEILSEVEGKIVAAQEGNILVTSFHPELTDDFSTHNYFLNMVEKSTKKTCKFF
ncbi:MAG: pyridoxal 5'-phosphate synthase glutaminase subunit PdxT [Clostridiales bacterium]